MNTHYTCTYNNYETGYRMVEDIEACIAFRKPLSQIETRFARLYDLVGHTTEIVTTMIESYINISLKRVHDAKESINKLGYLILEQDSRVQNAVDKLEMV